MQHAWAGLERGIARCKDFKNIEIFGPCTSMQERSMLLCNISAGLANLVQIENFRPMARGVRTAIKCKSVSPVLELITG